MDDTSFGNISQIICQILLFLAIYFFSLALRCFGLSIVVIFFPFFFVNDIVCRCFTDVFRLCCVVTKNIVKNGRNMSET